MPENCLICEQNNNQANIANELIWQNSDWLLRHHAQPYPLTGWLILQSKQHIQGIAQCNDKAAAEFGLLSKAISTVLQEMLTVNKVYLIAFGEVVPHLHLHFIPRYANMPAEFIGWGIADLYAAVANQTIPSAEPQEVKQLIQQLTAHLNQQAPIT